MLNTLTFPLVPLISLITFFGVVFPAQAQNTRIDSFSRAKKLAAGIYASHQQTFYCGCAYTGKEVDFTSCGYQPKGKPEAAKHLQWEHVVLGPRPSGKAFGNGAKATRSA